jgi:hypothetical protein
LCGNETGEFRGDWAELAALLLHAQVALLEAERRGAAAPDVAVLRRRVLRAVRQAQQDPRAAVTAVRAVICELE